MGPKQESVVEVERVVHGAGRMVRGNVERFEVVEVVLDLGSLHDVEPEMTKERLDSLQRSGDRMETARALPAPGKGDVDPLAPELGVDRRPGQGLPARL